MDLIVITIVILGLLVFGYVVGDIMLDLDWHWSLSTLAGIAAMVLFLPAVCFLLIPGFYILIRFQKQDIRIWNEYVKSLKQVVFWPITIWSWKRQVEKIKAYKADNILQQRIRNFYYAIRGAHKKEDIPYIKTMARHYEVPENIVQPIILKCKIGYNPTNCNKNYQIIQGFNSDKNKA